MFSLLCTTILAPNFFFHRNHNPSFTGRGLPWSVISNRPFLLVLLRFFLIMFLSFFNFDILLLLWFSITHHAFPRLIFEYFFQEFCSWEDRFCLLPLFFNNFIPAPMYSSYYCGLVRFRCLDGFHIWPIIAQLHFINECLTLCYLFLSRNLVYSVMRSRKWSCMFYCCSLNCT